MVLIPDAHCHLDEIEDPRDAVQKAREAGVGPILAMGMDRVSSRRTLDIKEQLGDLILTGVGIHPSYVPEWDDARLEEEFEFVRSHLAGVDCLGEVGLDYKDARDEVQRRRQHDVLDRQLALAREMGKPVSFHSRRSERPSVAKAVEFVRTTGLGINLHWFTHSEKLARKCGEAGVYISAGPAILWREDQARVAAGIHPDYLLTETDCPVPFNDESARPAWAARVAKKLAEVRGEPLETLQARVARNFQHYMGRPFTPGAGPGAPEGAENPTRIVRDRMLQ
jgi:TatD DNase family protein